MRCLVPLLAASCLVVAPCAAFAQPPVAPATEAAPPEAAETKGNVASPETAPAPGTATPSEGEAAEQAEPAAETLAPLTRSLSAEQNELRARIEATERARPLDDSVQRPLDFAKAALERSRANHAAGNAAGAARTERLARAAVELADARLRLLRERALYSAAKARSNVSSAELSVAQHALERERARARELERTSVPR